MEHTEVVKPETLDELIKALHDIFESDCINVEEVQDVMESYESKPQEWMQYAKFDQYRYTRNLVDEGNGKFNLMILCWGEGHGSSIHDHTNSHCFMKLLQGQLKETLFDWPDTKSLGDMVQRSQRILQENKVAYINGDNLPGEQLTVAKGGLRTTKTVAIKNDDVKSIQVFAATLVCVSVWSSSSYSHQSIFLTVFRFCPGSADSKGKVDSATVFSDDNNMINNDM
ncbi:hypothetical protein F2P81_014119 [Scophthalmus maximus]|uniref:Cysteine dioxygenase n=1 Tax=Scophthalmus maximus TaxID=52904 RepID=A0A6A4SIW2_SCOMX|nr:hypothetical protein F2P81_014119 [Scophthalmus maximus]